MGAHTVLAGSEELHPRSFWSRWIGVYFSPGETFQDIARKPDFLFPLVAAVLSAIAVTETMLAKIGMERIIRNSMEIGGQAAKMTPEQIQQAVDRGKGIGSILAHVGGILGAPIYLLVVAAIGLAIVNALFGSPISFRKAFSVTCYANLVGVIGAVMAVALILFGDVERFNPNNPAPTNLGFFLNPLETSKPVAALASSVDLFTIWFVILLGIGFSQATGGKVKARTIFLVYLGLWMVWVIGKVGLAAIS
ncbi:MAG: YIP1 family protein [Terriglobia bacterium]